MAKMKTLTINGQKYIVMDAEAWEQIGDLDTLATENKENLVAAVNEVLGKYGVGIHGTGQNAVVFNGGTAEQASGANSTVSGYGCKAPGTCGDAGGNETEAGGICAVTRGEKTYADGDYSEAHNMLTKASSYCQTVIGRNNIEDTEGKYLCIVGNSKNDDIPSNAYTLDWDGNGRFAGDVYVGSAADDENAVKVSKEGHTHSASDVSSGVLPVARGGTGRSSFGSNYGVLYGNGSNVYTTNGVSGALFKTGTTVSPQFGTLPIAQGGTGATTAANARSMLGIGCTALVTSQIKVGSSYTIKNVKNYNLLIFIGKPATGGSSVTVVLPAKEITRTANEAMMYQFADDGNYTNFSVTYDGTNAVVDVLKSSLSGYMVAIYGLI